MPERQPEAVLLFAGIGATAKGQRDIIGAKVKAIIERDDTCIQTLGMHFDQSQIIQADVKHFDFRQIKGGADILIGGPPCQPFSQAASDGSGEYDPRDCIPDFIRAVRDLSPRVFVMEEVQTLTWARHRAYLDRVLGDLRALGYVVDHKVLDMSRYGVPQRRKRLFVVGVRVDESEAVRWPPEIPSQTMAEALGWGPDEAAYRASLAPVSDPERAQWVYTRPSTTVVGSFRPEVQAVPGYRKAGDGPRQHQPGSVVITLEEALVLQGLPRDWRVAGTPARQRLQVGNSCPPAITALLVGANLPEGTGAAA